MFEPISVTTLGDMPAGLRQRLFPAGAAIRSAVEEAVAEILAHVRREGDAALCALTQQLDGQTLTPETLFVPPDALAEAAQNADTGVRAAIDGLIANVRRFTEPQRRTGYAIEGAHGERLEWVLRPLESVGVYVQGGRAAYPTTVVMNVVPAQIAGVPRIVAATPPLSALSNAALAYALWRLGVTEVLRVGGAQAVAALAYGTASVKPVDKIVGPGNAYVAAAKRQVFGQVGLDAIAGPSEVLILADESAPAPWIALDLLAQAEHDPEARVLLVTTSRDLAQRVSKALAEALAVAPRRTIAAAAIETHGANVVVPDWQMARALVNRVAPEHLQVMVAPETGLRAADFVAGAIFWGPHSPTAVGDYWAGPNHVLPTGGTARFRGPLGVDDFLVPTSVVTYTAEAGATLDLPRQLALAESLPAHAASLAARIPPR